MTDKMLKFVNIGQQTPPKRDVGNRKEDFNEIYDDFIKQGAQDQSSRCSQCGVPFSQALSVIYFSTEPMVTVP